MLSDLRLNGWLDTFWHFNLDLSVIVLTVLVVRFFIRKTTKSYNSYLLWLAIPVGFLLAKVVASIDFTSASSSYIGQAVSVMVMKPVETLQNYWWLGAIWLTGTTLLLLRLLIQHVELRRELKRIERPATDLKGYMNHKPKLYSLIAVEHDDMSPAVYGFIKPKIYFPLHVAEQLTAEQIQLIIEHEEQHIRQKHLWLNLLWDVLVCIGWFNPLIYIARKNFRHDQELFCDYLVLNKTDTSRTKDYGHALLSTVSATHSVSLLCSWKVFNQLEERIMNITKPINRTGKVALSLGAAMVLSCCAVYAANKEVKEERVVTRENITIDGNGQKKTVIEFNNGDGVVYLQEDDKYYIKENGVKREMTAEEKEKFEKVHEEAQKQLYLSEEELRKVEKEIEQAHRELELHVDEVKIAEEEIKHAHEEIARAQQEIVRVYEKGEISREEMQRIKKDLAKAKKQINAEKLQKRIRIDVERSKRDLEKARTEIKRQRSQAMRTPPMPPHEAHRIIKIDERVFSEGEGDEHRVINWTENGGKVYTVANGEYYVVENGKKRAMTSEEKARFEEKIKLIPKPPKGPLNPKAPKAPDSIKADTLTVIEQPQAEYPKEAKKEGIEGYVNLTFDVNNQGRASNIRVEKSSNKGLFNKAAIDAIKQWRFADKDYGKRGRTYQMKFALDS
ncbi:TonB family protein [Kangiella sediminilitoris]|uniref:TonB family protein n=2 Tax=Kangiella sediminilitoris TaxID=1144748 RepID=A0A1B3B9C7_9GAMM|nr:TonB family protein [Kangiella sediminilitoris]